MTRTTVRSALFVDFDNVYAGLGGRDSAAATTFATEPGRWVVGRYLPQLEWTGKPSPGYVYDPTRQRVSDLRQPTR